MSQLDPFIVYTVKLAMDFKSSTATTSPFTTVDTKNCVHPQDDPNHPLFPETIARILSIKSSSFNLGKKAPKLIKENILSLLYHADEQWIQSIKELSNINTSIENAVNHVHYQQCIFFDTLYILQKTMFNTTQSSVISMNHLLSSPKRFNESIWFAAQVLYHDCQIRHLEYFTDVLQPLAIQLYKAVEGLRFQLYDTLVKQNEIKKRYDETKSLYRNMTKRFSIWGLFNTTSTPPIIASFYKSKEHIQFLQTELGSAMLNLIDHWTQFENKLYACYVHAVFGDEHHMLQQEREKERVNIILPNLVISNSFYHHDTFTQLLPFTLERAIKQDIIDITMIQSFDPIAFVALPRLAILAGVTWLSHLTGWRSYHSTNKKNFEWGAPEWIQSHHDTMDSIKTALLRLEIELLKSQSEDSHHTFVKIYQRLEKALVYGQEQKQRKEEEEDEIDLLEKEIYLDICLVADSLLSNHYSQSFNIILCQLFKYIGSHYEIDLMGQEEEPVVDAQPLELTLLELAI
ncbi:uncharacterized protein BX663DRAFT_557349 [Cokeromyces recurvatus]|uniref:uncharacterized protein n=1 Tax=Cokeromyces recurvatus TaxID=90255 RepID=UPI0022202087|nr:uncharacterized protein BX663DRAFT_557349 [Cokeromyces recurvatus]KAI7908189.1 hypothetical protein BX663DRAFT_557349 [Cokeromyces recurvatus]